MKRVFAKNGEAVVRDVPVPDLRPGDVLIDVAYSAVSAGTEMWLIDGSGDPDFGIHEYPPDPPVWPKTRSDIALRHPMPRDHDPDHLALGYSVAGIVREVHPDVVDVKPGDRVAASGSQCAHHAEVVAVPRNLVASVPDAVPLEQACFVTLGSIAVAGLRETHCHFGETVVLYGVGLLGLLAGQIGTAAGLEIIGLDIDPQRLALAETLGVGLTANAATDDVVAVVRGATDGFGADSVILGLKSDSSEPLNLAFDMCRQRARVVAQGVFGWEIDRSRFYRNQVTLHPAIGYGSGRYDPVYEEGNVDYPIGFVRWTGNRNQQYFLGLLEKGVVQVGPLAPLQVAIEDAPDAYDALRRPNRPPTVVLSYPAVR